MIQLILFSIQSSGITLIFDGFVKMKPVYSRCIVSTEFHVELLMIIVDESINEVQSWLSADTLVTMVRTQEHKQTFIVNQILILYNYTIHATITMYFAKSISNLKHLPCATRLSTLKLQGLEYRRLIADLTMCYNNDCLNTTLFSILKPPASPDVTHCVYLYP